MREEEESGGGVERGVGVCQTVAELRRGGGRSWCEDDCSVVKPGKEEKKNERERESE